ncbi:MAG TPA: branched-chain amino acid ABC transporter permease [Burkholderiaceae bacterium]|nr:branched-chain amino acid ABC transporter permease [Burkholderiaceae bacterium]
MRAHPLAAVLVAAAIIALAAFPFVGGKFALDLVTKIMITAIFALSLELIVGRAGLVSFGHAAFFGIAAYVAALLTPQSGPASFWLLLPACVLAAGAYALAVGALSLRTRGVYFIMVTLAFAQMAYYVFHDTKLGGGSDGIYLNFRPALAIGGLALLDLDNARNFYWFVLGALAAVFGFLALLARSRFGHALSGIKANEQRMRAAGFRTYGYKLAAFVISAMLAGVAGLLYALKDGFVNPEIMSWHQSGAVLLMIILGGIGHLRGAVLGAFAFALLQELFQSQAIFGSFAKHWQLSLGLTIVFFVALLPQGLIGIGQVRTRLRSRATLGAGA